LTYYKSLGHLSDLRLRNSSLVGQALVGVVAFVLFAVFL
jgi:hypothetical protein